MDRAINRIFRRGLCTSHLGYSVSSSNVRKMFLDYFEREHDHLWIPSSPVMPDQDATLSFVNSGMNQFKDVFLGLATPGSKRIVNSQKCIRMKGKHNDLDVVGLDGYHHTFFEMLGNWSFGDYFKKEACAMSWNLLTKVYNIPENRLYVTYFKGDEALNLPPDTETRDVWAEIGVPQNRILPFGMKDNFWEMASTGPCGPCTEIHYDHDGRADASALVNTGSPRVVEIWNLVFIEFNRTTEKLESLGQHFVDTGMGFERLVALLQGQVSNYETDIFRPLFDVIQKMSGHPGYGGRYDGDEMDTAYRILADHSRTLTVTLSDGMLPNKQSKVRAILRRARMISKNSFKVEKGLIKELSNHVAEFLSPAYPEIGRNLSKVHYIIDEEEENFSQREKSVRNDWDQLLVQHPELRSTKVDAKMEFLSGYSYLKRDKKNSDDTLTNEKAWILFDTFGVPVKNFVDMARILGLKFDLAEYEKYEKSLIQKGRIMNEEKFKSEKALSEDMKEIKVPDLGPDPTEDLFTLEFESGSEGSCACKEIPVKILFILAEQQSLEAIKIGQTFGKNVAVVLDKTNCSHQENDVQQSDTALLCVSGADIHVHKVLKQGNKLFHFLSNKNFPLSTRFAVGCTGTLKPKESTRLGIMRSMTGFLLLKHLLHSKMKIFVEVSSYVGNDEFKMSFASYKDKLNVMDTLELEKAVSDAISNGVVFERRMRDVKEIGDIENFVVRPGQTFIKPKISVCSVTSRDFTTSFPCPGLVLSDASGLQDFIVTSLSKKEYRTKEIRVLTGEKAQIARKRNQEFLKNWNQMRDFHAADFADESEVEERIRAVTEFVKKLIPCKNISCYVKECLREETTSKLMLLQKYVKREIRIKRKIYRTKKKM